MAERQWKVYLAGEIHSDWRDKIAQGLRDAQLPVTLLWPITDHDASDNCGTNILGPEDKQFWKDHKAAGINAIRTGSLIGQADVVVVCFGGKYKQWNSAFDAGCAFAMGKPLICLHSSDLTHALKEIDRAAMAVAESTEQVVQILKYVTQ